MGIPAAAAQSICCIPALTLMSFYIEKDWVPTDWQLEAVGERRGEETEEQRCQQRWHTSGSAALRPPRTPAEPSARGRHPATPRPAAPRRYHTPQPTCTCSSMCCAARTRDGLAAHVRQEGGRSHHALRKRGLCAACIPHLRHVQRAAPVGEGGVRRLGRQRVREAGAGVGVRTAAVEAGDMQCAFGQARPVGSCISAPESVGRSLECRGR